MDETLELTPENAHESAELAVQTARESLGVVLDYSPRSLVALDALLERLHAEGQKSHENDGMVCCLGCYSTARGWRARDQGPPSASRHSGSG